MDCGNYIELWAILIAISLVYQEKTNKNSTSGNMTPETGDISDSELNARKGGKCHYLAQVGIRVE